MKTRIFFLIVILLTTSKLFAQQVSKPVIDFDAIKNWPKLGDVSISNDGNYFTIISGGFRNLTVKVQSTNTNWNKEFKVSSSNFCFSGNSRQLIFMSGDTLSFLQIGTEAPISKIPNVNAFKMLDGLKGEWLVYQVKNDAKELILINLFTGKEQKFSNVTDYAFSKKANVLLLKTEVKFNSQNETALYWINLKDGKKLPVWSSKTTSTSSYAFDKDGKQLVFMVQAIKDEEIGNELWYYQPELTKAELKVNNRSEGITNNMLVSGRPAFSQNGRWIFFNLELKKEVIPKADLDAVLIDVWSYKDRILQPQQTIDLEKNQKKTFAAAVDVADSKVIQIEHENEIMVTPPDQVTGDYTIVKDNLDVPWFKNIESFYIVSLKQGSRRLIKKCDRGTCNYLNLFSFSPSGRWLTFFDVILKNYFSYDIQSGQIQNISKRIHTSIVNDYYSGSTPVAVGTVGWLDGDKRQLIYDNYDVWAIAPSGSSAPINLTSSYGLKHHLKFRVISEQNESKVFDSGETIMLTAFNQVNKYNGFFLKAMSEKGDPKLLTFGPYTYYRVESQKPHFFSFDDGMPPMKARDVNVWIIKRETAKEAPNYYMTRDFQAYKQLTDYYPQRNYNWLTSELINYKQLDGTMSQGILYKPEDFDPHKKYPIIFNYYEALSHRLYEFPSPDNTSGNINIPWFVSRGFLVFTPDIYYHSKNIRFQTAGESAYNSIISSAQYLSKLSCVDQKHMGISGHSFGGGETNYLVTHTHLFIAANEAAGDSDPLSAYLSLVPFATVNWLENTEKQGTYESGHGSFYGTPWQQPNLFRRNSSVLNADKTTTPLLIMHNKKDNQIQWRQGVEMYLALRRLNKKVWLLQYDNGGHGPNGKDAVDYTIRLTQFFDYYLKGAPPTLWMTTGVPARLKGIETGYGYDLSGTKP